MTNRSKIFAVVAAAVIATSATAAIAASAPASSTPIMLPGTASVSVAECSLSVPARSPLGY